MVAEEGSEPPKGAKSLLNDRKNHDFSRHFMDTLVHESQLTIKKFSRHCVRGGSLRSLRRSQSRSTWKMPAKAMLRLMGRLPAVFRRRSSFLPGRSELGTGRSKCRGGGGAGANLNIPTMRVAAKKSKGFTTPVNLRSDVSGVVALPMALARRNRCVAIVLELGAANLPLQMKRPERIDSASRRSD